MLEAVFVEDLGVLEVGLVGEKALQSQAAGPDRDFGLIGAGSRG